MGDQVAHYLRAKFSTATVADLPKSEFEEALRWAIQNNESLVQQLGDSLAAVKHDFPNGVTQYFP